MLQNLAGCSRTRNSTTGLTIGSPHSTIYALERFYATSQNVEIVKPPNEGTVPVFYPSVTPTARTLTPAPVGLPILVVRRKKYSPVMRRSFKVTAMATEELDFKFQGAAPQESTPYPFRPIIYKAGG